MKGGIFGCDSLVLLFIFRIYKYLSQHSEPRLNRGNGKFLTYDDIEARYDLDPS